MMEQCEDYVFIVIIIFLRTNWNFKVQNLHKEV